MENEKKVLKELKYIETKRDLKKKYKPKKTSKNKKKVNKLIYIILTFIFFLLFFILILSLFNKPKIFATTNYNNKNATEKKIELLKLMTNNNILLYKGAHNCLLNDIETNYCIYKFICPKKVLGKNRILLGEKGDGSYVLLDDFENIKIAYSFGLGGNLKFDDELAKRNIDVFMYDHTINKLPHENARFHWKKIGIAGENEKNDQLKTLKDLIIENGHSAEKNMILKIDVECSEWDVFYTMSDDILMQFKYITIEFHFYDAKKEQIYYHVLKKLAKNHQVFYFRCNGRKNVAKFGNNRICWLLEISYIIKKDNRFAKDDSIYPIYELDFPGPNLDNEINMNIVKLFDDEFPL